MVYSGLKNGSAAGRRWNEQIAREQTVPRALGHDSDRCAEPRVGTGKAILDEPLALRQVLHDVGGQL